MNANRMDDMSKNVHEDLNQIITQENGKFIYIDVSWVIALLKNL